ncbi:MAG: peptidoglycan DD-metalloendopeptidase family protein [Caldilineaceae bacterium]|nr:peptidoglycan DD-metalloendopeptidase family protein [Caldilineaceae bacterium]
MFVFEVWPTEKRTITQAFGVNAADYVQFGLPGHEGVDIEAEHGSRIFCVAPGVVKMVQPTVNGHNYGIHVRVQHRDGYETIYAHLHSTAVVEGQTVAAGELLGLADSTGNARGSHLHLTLKQQGASVAGYPSNIIDPTPFLHPLMAAEPQTTRDGALYLSDQIADGSRFVPGTALQQMWTLRNQGTTHWGAGYQLALQNGEPLNATVAIPAPPTPPGGQADFAWNVTAPQVPGRYRSDWRMRNAAGEWFGERVWLDIQVEAAAPPVRVGQGNKLGFYLHLSTDQHGLWEAINRVQPPVLLIHADTANTMLLEEIRRFRAPDAFVIGRLYKDVHTQRQMLESNDPEGQGRALAEEILRYNFGLATKRGANGRLLIDGWMSLNEAVPGPASDQFQQQPQETARLLQNYDRFQVAFYQTLQAQGVEAIAFNFGAGNFTSAAHYLDYFPNTLAHYRYLGFHEYGWPTLYPAAGSATSGGSYRTCMAGIRTRHGDRHRVIITEAGLTRMYQNAAWGDVGWLNDDAPLAEEAYWQSLAWYNGHLTSDDYVLGACLFEVGHHGQWASFRHLGPNRQGQPMQLVDRIVALKDGAQPRGQVATAQLPLPPLPLTIHGTVTQAGRPVAGARVRLVGGQETLGSVQAAALDAATAITWTRAITGFTGTVATCWRKYVEPAVAGLTYGEFKQLVHKYNPALQTTQNRFVAQTTYALPENPYPAEIVWDRPLTGFAGTPWACWRHHVATKVIGLPYAAFRQQLVAHHPELRAKGSALQAHHRYTLPRTAGQTSYAVTAVTDRQGQFRFPDVPAGDYHVEVSAEGYWPFRTGFAAQADLTLPVTLQPVAPSASQLTAQATTRGPSSAFMRVAGNEFVCQDRPFRFVGANLRGLVHYGDGQTLPASSAGHRLDQLNAAQAAGMRVVRIFVPSVKANVAQTITRLRDLLGIIKTHFPEIYLLPALSNLYADVNLRVPGDDRFYQNNLLNKAFFTGGYQDNYLPFVREVVTAFRDEPQIMAWEIGNELKLDRGNQGDENDPNPLLYIDFVHTIASFIRRLAPNHLITTGMISTRHAWLFTPALKRRLYQSPNLDFITIHAYQGSNQEDDSPLARELELPFIIEEAGFDARMGEDRSPRVAGDMDKWFGLGARGYMQWGMMATPDNGDGDRLSGMDRVFHSDWDPLLRLYRARAQALAQVDPTWRPPKEKEKVVVTPPVVLPKPTKFTNGQTVFAQEWLNVRKSPGHLGKDGSDLLGLLSPGMSATIQGDAVARDGLTWWPIQTVVTTGAPVTGWAAAANAQVVLLVTSAPGGLRAVATAAADVAFSQASNVPQRFAQAWLNLRKDPGYVGKPSEQVIGQIPVGAPVMVLAGPQSADALLWWQVRATLADNSVAVGWVAEIDPNGLRLLAATPPPPTTDEVPSGGGSMPGYLGRVFVAGSAATVIAGSANIRASAGYVGQPAEHVLAVAAKGEKLTILAGPRAADGIDWMQVRGVVGAGPSVTGWIAIADPSGTRLLAPAPVAAAIRVQRPFAGNWALSQGWGGAADFYRQISYDGVPLRGHNGLDFATPVGTPLLAVDAGVVKRVDFEAGGFGHFMLLEHTWGESLYAHLSRIDLPQNATVRVGQPIGLAGESGLSYGAHLHFGIRLFPYRRTDGWGGFCDPTPFLALATSAGTRSIAPPRVDLAPEWPGRRRP